LRINLVDEVRTELHDANRSFEIEQRHVVLGLIFLKYISDSFEEHHAKLVAGEGDYAGANPEDPDEYRAASIFWVPKVARWTHLKATTPQPRIGTLVDDAMSAIERDNPSLKAVLPKDYARRGRPDPRGSRCSRPSGEPLAATVARPAWNAVGRNSTRRRS